MVKVRCTVYSQTDHLEDHFVVGRDRLTVDKDKMHHQYIYLACLQGKAGYSVCLLDLSISDSLYTCRHT